MQDKAAYTSEQKIQSVQFMAIYSYIMNSKIGCL